MDIPGKLRADVMRIFGSADPLNYIEDAKVTETWDETCLELTLRVPRCFDKYVRSSPLRSDSFNVDPRDIVRAAMCNCGLEPVNDTSGQKAPERKIHKVYIGSEAPIKWTLPDRVVYSGPKTIVFWPDGSKTMVSLRDGEEYDEYAAFCAAVVKRMFGATHKAKKFLDSVKSVQKKKKKTESETAPTLGTCEPEEWNCEG